MSTPTPQRDAVFLALEKWKGAYVAKAREAYRWCGTTGRAELLAAHDRADKARIRAYEALLVAIEKVTS